MLTRIVIKGLFGQFEEYDIVLKEGGVTILTGPNGYGKTTILKIINAFAEQNFRYLYFLPYKEIVLQWDGTREIRLEKQNEMISFYEGRKRIWEMNIFDENKIISQFEENKSFYYYTFMNEYNKKQSVNLDVITGKFLENHHTIIEQSLKKIIKPSAEGTNLQSYFPQFTDVLFIREQRLFKEMMKSVEQIYSLYNLKNDLPEGLQRSIEDCALDLKTIIAGTLARSAEKARNLDSTFPRRLIEQKEAVARDTYEHRFNRLKEIQKKLQTYGLVNTPEEDIPEFKDEDAKALTVYLDDTEQKIGVFDKLMQELDIFSDILNKRRLLFKTIKINKEYGFKFVTDRDKDIDAQELSSGEQHEIILLYDLLFKVKPGTLVLIDEPEISLHVAWMKDFLQDLFKIIELRKIQVIIATHSPQIINDRWDLTVDLWELDNARIS